MIYIYNFVNEKDMFYVCFFWLVDDCRCLDACLCAGKALQRGSCFQRAYWDRCLDACLCAGKALQRGSCFQRAHWEVGKEGTVADICASCLCSFFCSERALIGLSGLVFSV
jgi:hypothetical protein